MINNYWIVQNSIKWHGTKLLINIEKHTKQYKTE